MYVHIRICAYVGTYIRRRGNFPKEWDLYETLHREHCIPTLIGSTTYVRTYTNSDANDLQACSCTYIYMYVCLYESS